MVLFIRMVNWERESKCCKALVNLHELSIGQKGNRVSDIVFT